jgi:hypothetical protein
MSSAGLLRSPRYYLVVAVIFLVGLIAAVATSIQQFELIVDSKCRALAGNLFLGAIAVAILPFLCGWAIFMSVQARRGRSGE